MQGDIFLPTLTKTNIQLRETASTSLRRLPHTKCSDQVRVSAVYISRMKIDSRGEDWGGIRAFHGTAPGEMVYFEVRQTRGLGRVGVGVSTDLSSHVIGPNAGTWGRWDSGESWRNGKADHHTDKILRLEAQWMSWAVLIYYPHLVPAGLDITEPLPPLSVSSSVSSGDRMLAFFINGTLAQPPMRLNETRDPLPDLASLRKSSARFCCTTVGTMIPRFYTEYIQRLRAELQAPHRCGDWTDLSPAGEKKSRGHGGGEKGQPSENQETRESSQEA